MSPSYSRGFKSDNPLSYLAIAIFPYIFVICAGLLPLLELRARCRGTFFSRYYRLECSSSTDDVYWVLCGIGAVAGGLFLIGWIRGWWPSGPTKYKPGGGLRISRAKHMGRLVIFLLVAISPVLGTNVFFGLAGGAAGFSAVVLLWAIEGFVVTCAKHVFRFFAAVVTKRRRG